MAEPMRMAGSSAKTVPKPVELDGDDEPTSPDGHAAHTELIEAVEWLRKKGIVSDAKPAFATFYEELVADEE